MISKEYLQEHNINSDNCMIYWLAGMSQKEWIRLPWEKKVPILKHFNRYWPIMRNRVKFIQEARQDGKFESRWGWKLLDRYNPGIRYNIDASWPPEESGTQF